jgi:hypothetical protein
MCRLLESKFRFPTGATGFGPVGCSAIDGRRFRAACFSAAPAAGWAVRAIYERAYPRSYHRALVTKRDEAISILCNVAHPFVGFSCQDFAPLEQRPYVDLDELAESLRTRTSLLPLSAKLLQTSITPEMLTRLSSDERKQLKYWQRGNLDLRVGDVLFNAWD